MDLWLCYQNTDVWMVTRYLPGQGHPYDERGWPKWERMFKFLVTSRTYLDLFCNQRWKNSCCSSCFSGDGCGIPNTTARCNLEYCCDSVGVDVHVQNGASAVDLCLQVRSIGKLRNCSNKK